mgnify:CR=1 FL=1
MARNAHGGRDEAGGVSAVMQLELFAVAASPKLGARGFPMCQVCETRESIGPHQGTRLDLCTRCWSPVLDPIGAASWDRITSALRKTETVRVTGGVL